MGEEDMIVVTIVQLEAWLILESYTNYSKIMDASSAMVCTA